MVPAERHVNDVRLFTSLKLLNFLGRKITVILGRINLKAFAINVDICVDLLQV